jgi:hypothetical protein
LPADEFVVVLEALAQAFKLAPVNVEPDAEQANFVRLVCFNERIEVDHGETNYKP